MNGIKSLKNIALDSNIFIYNFEQNPQYTPFSDILFKALISNRLKAVTSVISLTEILSFPKTEEVVKKIVEDFLGTPNLQIVDVNKEVAVEAAKVRREYKFRLPDAVQLATALHSKAKAFITNDDRLKRFKKLPIILLKNVKP